MVASKCKIMNNDILTPREIEVLMLIANELSDIQIAAKLFISFNTAQSHRKRLLNKLNVKNAAGLVRRGFELRILHV